MFVRNLVFIAASLVMILFSYIAPSAVSLSEAIGWVFIISSGKIFLELFMGWTVYFYFAGKLPNEDKYQAARSLAFFGAFLPLLVGGYIVFTL